jgi:hypothetical protein
MEIHPPGSDQWNAAETGADAGERECVRIVGVKHGVTILQFREHRPDDSGVEPGLPPSKPHRYRRGLEPVGELAPLSGNHYLCCSQAR